MYYLEDKHQEYEYNIYCRINNGIPFLHSIKFLDFNEIMNFIKSVEKRCNRYHYTFYIDNDFYKNEFEKENVQFYYKVLERKVYDWSDYDNHLKKYDNIYYFFR